MDKKQEREWCPCVFNIETNGLAMELFQTLPLATTTIVVHIDVLLGLVSISKQHQGKETETHGGLKANEKPQVIE